MTLNFESGLGASKADLWVGYTNPTYYNEAVKLPEFRRDENLDEAKRYQVMDVYLPDTYKKYFINQSGTSKIQVDLKMIESPYSIPLEFLGVTSESTYKGRKSNKGWTFFVQLKDFEDNTILLMRREIKIVSEIRPRNPKKRRNSTSSSNSEEVRYFKAFLAFFPFPLKLHLDIDVTYYGLPLFQINRPREKKNSPHFFAQRQVKSNFSDINFKV